MRRTATLALILAIAMGALAWWYTPRQVLERRIHQLFATLEIPKKPDALRRALRASALDSQLAEQVALATPEPRASGTFSRQELLAGFAAMLESHTATFHDIQVDSLEITAENATARVTFRATIASPGRTIISGPCAASLTMTRADDDWRLTEATLVEHP